MNLYYISFATDTEFLGATVVEGFNETHALEIATNNALNPGGQAAIICLPEQLHYADDIVPLKYKLIGYKQMKDLGAQAHKDLDEDVQNALQHHSVVFGD